ncbi:3-hydroxyacyl-CoA dehydrogenase family protein [Humibacter sp.]|uniref:3-hydroxyacyl-CoA dehydrogenase family protein n=1 Tax=Humibacter sp. TaxID=1940291 RepID=UPI003F7FAFFD
MTATLPRAVGVLGGGTMGAGIAHAFLVSGCLVHVVERDDEQCEAACARVLRAVRASVERGTTDESVEALSERLSVGTTDEAFAECGLVIEAVPEQFELKVHSLGRIARSAPDAIIASNTSSISIDDLAATLPEPERFLGLHFFNPVPASKLVEVVRGAATSDETLHAAQGWVAAIGKTAVTVADAPGFASSRLGVALGLEAIRMLEEGVASAEDIDRAMELGYRHPVGPLRLTDIVGLDVRLGIAEYLHGRLGARFEPPQLLRDKVAAGELGRKTGRGFFTWDVS